MTKTAVGFNEALQVRYKDEPIMVGKIFTVAGSLVFLHEQSGSQKHWSTDCTSPVDVGVIEYLREINVPIVHAAREGSKKMLTASPELIETKGQRLGYDHRDRYYLPDFYWTEVTRGYAIPFCPREHIIECPSPSSELPPIVRPTCDVCARPMSAGRGGSSCGGIESTVHAGVTRNGVTCRYQDDTDPVSTWEAERDRLREKAKKR